METYLNCKRHHLRSKFRVTGELSAYVNALEQQQRESQTYNLHSNRRFQIRKTTMSALRIFNLKSQLNRDNCRTPMVCRGSVLISS
jgi:hypothetical protein